MIDTFGRSAEMAGGSAAIGSSRYSLRSSSLNGTVAQKYENVLLSGIISLRKRSANWPTLTLERSGWAAILVGIRLHFNIDQARTIRNLGVRLNYSGCKSTNIGRGGIGRSVRSRLGRGATPP